MCVGSTLWANPVSKEKALTVATHFIKAQGGANIVLTAITLNSKVETVGKNAFYGCKKLKTVTIKTVKLTEKNVGTNAFKGIYSTETFKCPAKKLKAYKKLIKKAGAPGKAKYKK